MTTPIPLPPIERLLEHREWVRHVARSLVRDDSAADDLAQDAWLDALRRPPRDASSPRGWLSRVLRRNAVDTWRAERRRTQREEVVARPERLGDGADSVAEAEVRRQVVDAVLALSEPTRGTILLRFFDGLTPSGIAVKQGVPVETVRTRIRRGLAEVREQFDRDRGGRAAWVPLLAPLTGDVGAGNASASANGSGRNFARPTGRRVPWWAALLAPWGLGAALIVACGVAVAVAVRGAEPDADFVEVAGSGTDADGGGTGAAPKGPGARAGRAAAVETLDASSNGAIGSGASALPADTWLAIHVLDEDGNALSRATLRVTVSRDASAALRRAAGEHSVTGRNPFPIRGLPEDADGEEIVLSATAAGWVSPAPSSVTLESGRMQVTRVVLFRPRAIPVVVRDSVTGAPITGARVVSRTACGPAASEAEITAEPTGPGWATTDATGAAKIPGLARGRHVVWFDAPGYLPALGRATSGSDDAAGVDLRLVAIPAPGSVRVTVRAIGGGPVPGAKVFVGFTAPPAPALERRTGADGVVLFDDLPPGRLFFSVDAAAVLRASPKPLDAAASSRVCMYGEHAIVEVESGRTRDITLGDIPEAGRIVVRVNGPDGRPRPGARVVLLPGILQVTGDDGSASFAGLRPGDSLWATVEGWMVPVGKASIDPEPFTYEIGPHRVELDLRVGGVPAAWATVDAWTGAARIYVSADASGRVVLDCVPAGGLRLTVFGMPSRDFGVPSRDVAKTTTALVTIPPEGLAGPAVVDLRPCGVIRVRGVPRDAVVVATRPGFDPAPLYLDRSSTTESLRSQGIPAGTWTIERPSPEGPPARREVEVREGEEVVVVW